MSEDPPPAPGVTPDPADPVPDVVLAGTGMAGVGRKRGVLDMPSTAGAGRVHKELIDRE